MMEEQECFSGSSLTRRICSRKGPGLQIREVPVLSQETKHNSDNGVRTRTMAAGKKEKQLHRGEAALLQKLILLYHTTRKQYL